MALPAIVVLLGVLVSVGVFVRVNTDSRLESAENLAETGAALVRYAEMERKDAVEQAVATEGLFESSEEVTDDEFTHFAETIRKENGTGVAFAPRVTAAEFDRFVAEARGEFPTFAIRDTEFDTITAEDDGVYWPLLYKWGMSEAGFGRGFDFASDPAISQAIQASLETGQPAASQLLTLPGDDEPGEFVIVTVVGSEQLPDGIAVVTLPLDELLNDRIHVLLGLRATVTLTSIATAEPAGTEGNDGSDSRSGGLHHRRRSDHQRRHRNQQDRCGQHDRTMATCPRDKQQRSLGLGDVRSETARRPR